MKDFVARIALTALAVAFGAGYLALSWNALASTQLDLPPIGGVGDYFAASVGVWFVGEALTTGLKITAALGQEG